MSPPLRRTFRIAFVSAHLPLLVLLASTSVVRSDRFIRGDTDASESLEITDAVRVFGFLFLGAPMELDCRDAADADDSGGVDISDGIYVLNWLFSGGPPPPGPFPGCGDDSTADALDCAVFPACPAPPASPGILRTSPRDGEDGVAVTRETVIEMAAALDPASVTPEAVFAAFGGGVSRRGGTCRPTGAA